MSYSSFENRWIGKRVDVDKVYQYQCVDLILQYLDDEFGGHTGIGGDAKEYWLNTPTALLTKFNKVSGSDAKAGDIVVLKPIDGQSNHRFGHIGIATGQTGSNSVEILEQNGTGGGTGIGTDAIRKRTVSRSRIYGLLRPKSNGGEGMFNGQNAEFWYKDANRWHVEAEKNLALAKKLQVEKDKFEGESSHWHSEADRLQKLLDSEATVLKPGKYQIKGA